MSGTPYPTPSWDSVLASTYGMSVLVVGAFDPGIPGADTIIDFQFPEDREVQGGDVSAWAGGAGDRISMGVFDPSSGVPVEVRRVASEIALPASKLYAIRVGYSMALPAGALFRITYKSIGTVAPQISVNIFTWLEGNGVP